jgi:hypothetical protein
MIYEYVCPKHGKFEAWVKMEDRHQAQRCRKPGCVRLGKFTISAPLVISDYPGYISHSTGEWVEGRRARVEDMAKSGCRPYEAGEMKDLETRKRLIEAKQEADMDVAVEKTLWEITN